MVIISAKITQLILFIIILVISILALIEDYKTKHMMTKLKIAEENNKNIKEILNKYLNKNINN